MKKLWSSFKVKHIDVGGYKRVTVMRAWGHVTASRH